VIVPTHHSRQIPPALHPQACARAGRIARASGSVSSASAPCSPQTKEPHTAGAPSRYLRSSRGRCGCVGWRSPCRDGTALTARACGSPWRAGPPSTCQPVSWGLRRQRRASHRRASQLQSIDGTAFSARGLALATHWSALQRDARIGARSWTVASPMRAAPSAARTGAYKRERRPVRGRRLF
jgi:hypothetical protein